jgi:hypothetical protein
MSIFKQTNLKYFEVIFQLTNDLSLNRSFLGKRLRACHPIITFPSNIHVDAQKI